MIAGSVVVFAFLAGFAAALMLVLVAAAYLFSDSAQQQQQQKGGGSAQSGSDKPADLGPLHEAPSSDADKKVLKQAIKSIRACLTTKQHDQGQQHGVYSLSSESAGPDQSQVVAEYPTEERAPAMSCQDMEQSFVQVSLELKERHRHVEALVAFLVGFGRLQEDFSRELSRLSHVAESHVAQESKTHLDSWWTSLSIALDHLSQDHRYIAEVAGSKIAHELPKAEQEMVVRKLYSKGLAEVQKLREATSVYDAKRKEFARLKEQAVSKFEGMSLGEHSKLVLRLEQSESLLKQARTTLATVEENVRVELPPIIADYEVIASTSLDAIMSQLVAFSGLLVTTQHKNMHIANRLKIDVANLASRAIDKGSNVHLTVLEILEQMERGDDVKVDMRSEAMAALAASLLSELPALPPNFSKCITEETCVWVNAFLGRMYRDTARSANFHEWFCTKAAIMLNKGKRPDYIDTYTVSNAVFGSSPPQVRNIVWLPHCPLLAGQKYDPEHNIACSGDLSFRSGLSFIVTTKIWINWPRDRYAFIPVSMKIELCEISGRIHFGVQKRASFISFLEEPYTRFSVTSEVGGQYKLKDVPRVSTMVIQKIKKYIRSKTVFPKAYKFRLMWPKKWWPEGEDEYKESAPSAPATATTTVAPASETIAPSTSEPTSATAAAKPADANVTQASVPAPAPVVEATVPSEVKHANFVEAVAASPSEGARTTVANQASKSFEETTEDSSEDDGSLVRNSSMFGQATPQLGKYKHELEKTSELWSRHYRRTFLGGSHSTALSGDEFLEVEDRMIQIPSLSFLLEKCQDRHGLRRRSLSESNMSLMEEIHPTLSSGVAAFRLNGSIRMRSNSISDFRRMRFRETAYSRFLFDYGNLMRRGGYTSVKESISLGTSRRRSLSWRPIGSTTDIIHLEHAPGRVYISCVPGRMRDISLPPDREMLKDICENLGKSLVPSKKSKLHKAAKVTSSLLSNFKFEEWSATAVTVTQAFMPSNLSSFLGFFKATNEVDMSDEEAVIGGFEEDFEIKASVVEAKKSDHVEVKKSDPAFDPAPEIGPELLLPPGPPETIPDTTTVEVSQTTLTEVSEISAAHEVAEYAAVLTDEKIESEPAKADVHIDVVENKAKPSKAKGAARVDKFAVLMQRNADAMKKLMAPTIPRGPTYSPVPSSSIPAVEKPTIPITPTVADTPDVDLALQAREAALTAAFANEMPRMQSFLYLGKQVPSNKKWLVLRDGFIGIFNDPSDNTEFGSPRQVLNLCNSVCRPHGSDLSCFELGLALKNQNTSSSEASAPGYVWMAMWADSQVQCRAWIMAIQHSSQRRGPDQTTE